MKLSQEVESKKRTILEKLDKIKNAYRTQLNLLTYGDAIGAYQPIWHAKQ